MQNELPISEILKLRDDYPLIDVRTPAEFEHAHIPGAINIPLFSNKERAVVGTIYKKKGKEKAVLQGLDFVGPKLRSYVEQAQQVSRDNTVMLHCWRGGMRSGSMAWLLRTAGLQASTLTGGYKSYRRLAHEYFVKKWKFKIIGGYTGAGKTKLLYVLEKHNTQLIDLEGLANHKGSAFGHLYQEPQESTEQFENLLFEKLLKADPQQTIWLEDESQSIGKVWLPQDFYNQMRQAPIVRIDLDFDIRVKQLAAEYARSTNTQKEALVQSVTKIRKRLGGLRAQEAIIAIDENRFEDAVRIVLPYYDKTYKYGLDKRKEQLIRSENGNHLDYEKLAQQLLKN